jgi:hypothetical protein
MENYITEVRIFKEKSGNTVSSEITKDTASLFITDRNLPIDLSLNDSQTKLDYRSPN